MKDRRKEFPEVTLARSGHVTASYYLGSEGQGRVSNICRDQRRESFSVEVEVKGKSWSRGGQGEGVP